MAATRAPIEITDMNAPRVVIDLRDPHAREPDLVGAKAANLARAAQVGLAILPGFVLTTAGSALGTADPGVVAGLRDAWEELRRQHPGPVVVRSSSTLEDAAESSMAGQFTSVLDVAEWASMRSAVDQVLESAERVSGSNCAQPMAVLVQPQLDLVVGGVMFGVDPVSGDPHHVVVDAVATRVDDLVSGRVTAAHYVLSRRGRVLQVVHADAAPALTKRQRRDLVHLAGAAQRAFGCPQDLEWAFDRHDRLRLLQSRPVTAITTAQSSVFLGPGPVAETFPHPLRALETGLWIEPLRDAITRALLTTRAVSRRRLQASPVLTTVRGYAAVDLDLLGVVRVQRSRWRALDPRPGARRLFAAWRVGRLRVALPALAADVVETVDEDLAGIGALADYTDAALMQLLDASRRELATVHTIEILTGMLCPAGTDEVSLPVVAMHALLAGRAEGLADAEIVARNPEVLALMPPALDGSTPLPNVDRTPAHDDDRGDDVEALDDRDALRLRTRWLQELLARAARELAQRLVIRGALQDASALRDCTYDEVARMVRGQPAPPDLAPRAARRPGPPLPSVFRLTSGGDVVPRAANRNEAGVPAGGGRGAGIVRHSIEGNTDVTDTVLVVTNLEPELAAVLPGLAGLVAETGSPLSHLAILAREMHVPTVVAVPDARRRFARDTRVLVDGTTGEVSALPEEVAP